MSKNTATILAKKQKHDKNLQNGNVAPCKSQKENNWQDHSTVVSILFKMAALY